MEVEDQTLDSTLFYEGMLHFVNQFINIYVSVCYSIAKVFLNRLVGMNARASNFFLNI